MRRSRSFSSRFHTQNKTYAMGQYYLIANHDRKEYIQPASQKLHAIVLNDPAVLPYLLKQTDVDGQGSGDLRIPKDEYPVDGREKPTELAAWLDSDEYQERIQKRWPHAGRWAGQRVCVIGDYDSSGLFSKIQTSDEWDDITEPVRAEAKAFEKDAAGRAGTNREELHPVPDLVLKTRT
jgi:hypothetical protein